MSGTACNFNPKGFYMKKIYAALPLAVVAMTLSNVSYSADPADKTVTATAIWQAEASKDTKSELVVTPMRALVFKYSPSSKSFNQDIGTFDVAIKGDHSSAKSFKLEARIDDGNNTLRQMGGKSTLQVGGSFGSSILGSSAGGTDQGVGANSNWTTLIDSGKDIGTGSALWNLSQEKGSADTVVSARDNFKFSVVNASVDGIAKTTDMSTLPDGMWQGEVAVAFRATWEAPAAP